MEGGLGFKCLKDFNLAMLAKQVWRLHTIPNSLISKVFKARYYPNSDILQANIDNTPSYAWRSIQAINIINKGCCWRVWKGDSIKIWEDSWLPRQNGYKIITPAPSHQNIRLVKDLSFMTLLDGIKTLLTTIFSPLKGYKFNNFLSLMQNPMTLSCGCGQIMETIQLNLGIESSNFGKAIGNKEPLTLGLWIQFGRKCGEWIPSQDIRF
jgi:hypothetical protein